MSYKQAIKWARKHPKGTRQPIIMSTGSGFWPSAAWMEHDWLPYVAACQKIGVAPVDREAFYRWTASRSHFPRTPDTYALMTQLGTVLR